MQNQTNNGLICLFKKIADMNPAIAPMAKPHYTESNPAEIKQTRVEQPTGGDGLPNAAPSAAPTVKAAPLLNILLKQANPIPDIRDPEAGELEQMQRQRMSGVYTPTSPRTDIAPISPNKKNPARLPGRARIINPEAPTGNQRFEDEMETSSGPRWRIRPFTNPINDSQRPGPHMDDFHLMSKNEKTSPNIKKKAWDGPILPSYNPNSGKEKDWTDSNGLSSDAPQQSMTDGKLIGEVGNVQDKSNDDPTLYRKKLRYNKTEDTDNAYQTLPSGQGGGMCGMEGSPGSGFSGVNNAD